MRFISRSPGFSLIELMIVLTIIGILAVVAVPSYQVYAQKARFAEVIAATETFRLAVALALQEGVVLAELANGMHGIPEVPKPTKNVASVKVAKGTITAVGTEQVAGMTYILKPSSDGNAWTVGGTCLKNGFCRD